MKTKQLNETAIFKDKRTLIKAIGWEVIAFFIVVFFYWLWFGSFMQSLLSSIIITIIKSIGLFFYLKIWKRTKWLK